MTFRKTHAFIAVFLFPWVLTTTAFTEEQNQDIRQFMQEYARTILACNPDFGYALGIPESMDFPFNRAALTDRSPQALDDEYTIHEKFLHALQDFTLDDLDPIEGLNVRILTHHLTEMLEGKSFRYHRYYIVNPQFGLHTALLNTLVEHHPLETQADAENYIARLAAIPLCIDQALELLTIQQERRFLPHRAITENFLRTLDDFRSLPAEENILNTHFQNRLKKIKMPRQQKQILSERVLQLIHSEVYPAYAKLQDRVSVLLPLCDTRAGVWKFPQGNDYYAFCLYEHSGLRLDPEQLHLTGISEVRRIQNEIREKLASLGYAADLPFPQLFRSYQRDLYSVYNEQYVYPNSEIGGLDALRDYQHMIKDIRKRLPDYFSLLPQAEVAVVPLPEHMYMAPPHSYHRASLDGSRAAAFYTNLATPPRKPDMPTLLYHETIPGHHLQIAIAQENASQYMFRNFTHYTAYIEGWALYAERLAYENGWMPDVHAEIGYLSSELLRAARLVIDTGIHHYRWTRAMAYDYMLTNLGWGSLHQIDRYILWPGQACAYKIGERKILDLRTEMQQALGDRFDIRDFHRVVLQNGALPLPMLEKQLRNYIHLHSSPE